MFRGLLFILLFSAAVYGNSKSTMYLDITPGVAYSSFLEKDDYFENRLFYEGWGSGLDVKLGSGSPFFAFYFEIQLMKNLGEFEKEFSPIAARARRSMLGIGMSFFPWKNPESPMYGSFLGFSLGKTSVEVISAKTVVIEEEGIHVSMELGKVWKFNDNWSIGFNFLGTKDYPIRMGEVTSDYHFYTVWFGIKFLRR